MLMADMGAEIIRINLPFQSESNLDGIDTTNQIWEQWNRGQRSLELDYTKKTGFDALKQLIKVSDVLIEDWVPSKSKSLHMDFETVQGINPKLLYCAMPPFGESGPLSDIAADDGVVSTIAGIHGDQGGGGNPPIYVKIPFVSYGTAFLASFAITTALFERESSKMGQKIEVPLYFGAIAMKPQYTILTTKDSSSHSRSPTVTSNSQPIGNPVYGLYECSDGWIFVAAGNEVFWEKFCFAIKMPELAQDKRFFGAPWNIPPENQGSLHEIIKPILKSGNKSYWLNELSDADVPSAPASNRSEFLSHPQVMHNEILVENNDPKIDSTHQFGIPIKMSKTPGDIGRPIGIKSKDTWEILSSIEFTRGQLINMSKDKIIPPEDGKES
jgi:crotonobetainyl-CoA:carnitine CoA-transferase CaiB-like acyl-CoA transferase